MPREERIDDEDGERGYDDGRIFDRFGAHLVLERVFTDRAAAVAEKDVAQDELQGLGVGIARRNEHERIKIGIPVPDRIEEDHDGDDRLAQRDDDGNIDAEIAGAVSDEPLSFSRSVLAAEVINELLTLLQTFTDRKFMTEYRRRCFILGKDIRIYSFGDKKGIRARAIDIDRDGGLVVEYMEGHSMREIKTITTGEVSVRFE